MSLEYWAVARLQAQRESLALHCLSLSGFTAYLPRLRVRKMTRGRRITATPPLFPGYLFVLIRDGQWWDARWAPGIISLIMDGTMPAHLPESAIVEIRSRETGGLITLERQGVKRGDRVRILRGPFQGNLAIYHDSKPRDRIEVLLQLLGSTRSATLESLDVELAK